MIVSAPKSATLVGEAAIENGGHDEEDDHDEASNETEQGAQPMKAGGHEDEHGEVSCEPEKRRTPCGQLETRPIAVVTRTMPSAVSIAITVKRAEGVTPASNQRRRTVWSVEVTTKEAAASSTTVPPGGMSA